MTITKLHKPLVNSNTKDVYVILTTGLSACNLSKVKNPDFKNNLELDNCSDFEHKKRGSCERASYLYNSNPPRY